MLAADLDVDIRQGLSEQQVLQASDRHGLNEIKESGQTMFLQKLTSQFTDMMIIVLLEAGIIVPVSLRLCESINICTVEVENGWRERLNL